MIPATVIAPWQLAPGEAQVSPGDFGRHYACVGDSWASFGSVLGNGIVHALQFPERALITNLAVPGQTLGHVVTHPSQHLQLLRDWKLDGVLCSAGGNDMIDALPRIVRGGAIDWKAWGEFAAQLQTDFAALVHQVDGRAPVYIHTYDFPTPRPAGAGFGIGPWLLPALQPVAPTLRARVADLLFQELRGALQAVPGVAPIDTVGTLTRAEPVGGVSGDWINEIHPTRGGYRKLASVWQAVLS